jgi:hypothetical protein
MPVTYAFHHRRHSRVHHTIDSMLSYVKPRCFYPQVRASAESSISTLEPQPDRHGDIASHRRLAKPAFRKNNSFSSLIRRIVNTISAGLSPHLSESHAKLERRHVKSTAPLAASYGCTTVTVNRKCYDVPTLAWESGLRTVRNTSILLETERSNRCAIQFGEREVDGDMQPPSFTTIELGTGLEEILSQFNIDDSEGGKATGVLYATRATNNVQLIPESTTSSIARAHDGSLAEQFWRRRTASRSHRVDGYFLHGEVASRSSRRAALSPYRRECRPIRRVAEFTR